MNKELDQILGILRSVADDGEKLRIILHFLETEIVGEEESFFPEVDLPEKYKDVVKEIADNIHVGFICFLNPDTLETESFTDEMLSEIDEDEREETLERVLDLYGIDEIKFWDWNEIIEFSPLYSHESFRIMEAFAENLKDDAKLQSKLFDALSRRKPFANFNNVLYDSDRREDWFDFKQKWLENKVAQELLDKLEYQ